MSVAGKEMAPRALVSPLESNARQTDGIQLAHRPLLGRIAEFGLFTNNGEPAATRALAILLEVPLLRDALLADVSRRTGADVRAVRWIHSERSHHGFGRTDLEGVDDHERPILVIEAKFGAWISVEQLRDYLRLQERELGFHQQGALVLLVPAARVAEGERAVASAQRETLADTPSAAVVMTWDELLNVLQDAVAHLPVTLDAVAADVVQFKALCLAMQGFVVAPITGPATWPPSEDLLRLFHQVSEQLREPKRKMLPIVHEPGFDPMRYMYFGGERDYLAIGLASRFADTGLPLWVRYENRDARHFAKVRGRVMVSEHKHSVVPEMNHKLWLPLTIEPDLAGQGLVQDIVAQIRGISSIIAPNLKHNRYF